MFDNRLKMLREAKGLSMKQVAEDLQIPYTTYIHYEKNDNEPNSDVLVRLAMYFDISVDYLLGLPNGKSSPPVDDEREALRKMLETMSKPQLKEIRDFMEFLVWKEQQG